MTVHALQRERFKPGTVVVVCCTRCERDVVYLRVEVEHVQWLSRWFGCDCEPERPRLNLEQTRELVARRIDTASGLHVERWKERS